VILLHVLPVAVVAPGGRPPQGRAGKVVSRSCSRVCWCAIALAWALPAGYFGGEAYRRAIFWGQTAGACRNRSRIARPWWYYAPLLPAILFPWLVWPRSGADCARAG
jgi:hypothetical protein